MSLVVNHNMMAANTARNLNAHYGRLATSTQRLSSGLRINSAADDAAGLAIRELQRADIAALHQGARNANDAISMIQVADGALGIIDEKLIRMKELAEQAATGTYDSTQRLMIESEYQAMASEITRIANATDFNGTKLLDGTLAGDHDGSGLISEGKMKIHFGTGNDSAEDYYYIEIGECTSEAFGLGNNSTWQDVQRRGVEAFKESLRKQIKNDNTIDDKQRGELLAGIDKAAEQLNNAITDATDYRTAYQLWSAVDGEGFMTEGKNWIGNSDLMDRYLAAAEKAAGDALDAPTVGADVKTNVDDAVTNGLAEFEDDVSEALADPKNDTDAKKIEAIKPIFERAKANILAEARKQGLNDDEIDRVTTELNTAWDTFTKASPPAIGDWQKIGTDANTEIDKYLADDGAVAGTTLQDEIALRNVGAQTAQASFNKNVQTFWDSLRTTEKQKLQYAWGQAALYNLANADPDRVPGAYGINAPDFEFAGILGKKENADGTFSDITLDNEMLDQALKDMQARVGHMDFAGYTIETQEDAQMALDAINDAIIAKDKIRAHLGAAQNRLENTISNLNIQAENLQAAESRISDVDVATEMTEFVRNQILTQSAVAMLSQANSLPQMAMQLIGG